MSIGFTRSDWERTRENAAKWWSHELGRPLIQITLGGRDPGRQPSRLPYIHFTSHYGLDVSAADIVDAWDYELSCRKFLGDAFPVIFPNFGPGVGAAFMGAITENGSDTTWFHPPADVEIAGLDLTYDAANPWLARVRDVCRTACERWNGEVQVAMTDIGGAVDILSTFRPGERLLLDLYDCPDAVKRKTWEAHDLWWRYYDELCGIMSPNPGYSAWIPLFSDVPYYVLQCDFCYMIGPDMFEEFVKPELAASCRKLGHAFYHLDGPGELPHLDSLLEIEELAGVQWVPGTGAPNHGAWPEVFRKIRDAGKLIQIFGSVQDLMDVMEIVDGYAGVAAVVACENESEALELLDRFGSKR